MVSKDRKSHTAVPLKANRTPPSPLAFLQDEDNAGIDKKPAAQHL